jgi:hypothetical protein
MMRGIRSGVFVVVSLLATGSCLAARIVLHDQAQLETALKRSAPCCVVDARSEGNRRQSPLQDAVIYRKGVRIKPTAAVVVIADSDDQALVVGQALAKSTGAQEVLAVKGGITTWRALMAGKGNGATGGLPATFVIPRNTCEQGAPLQELKFKRE